MGVLSSEGLIKQTDTGKRLLQQLQAMKHLAISSPEADADAAGVKVPAAAGNDKTVTYELYYSPENARLHAATKTAELAERLAILERAVGSTQMQSGVSLWFFFTWCSVISVYSSRSNELLMTNYYRSS